MAQQLIEAGLYELVLTLLKTHSQIAGQREAISHKDTLDWLQASHVGSPMAPLSEDHPVNLELKTKLDSLKGDHESARGNRTQHSPKFAFQPDCANQSARPLLMTAQTMPPPKFQSVSATTSQSPLVCTHGGTSQLPADDEEAAAAGEVAGNSESQVKEEDDFECLSGDVTLVDRVVLAALEVLFKLATSPIHLQAFRCHYSFGVCLPACLSVCLFMSTFRFSIGCARCTL